MEMWKTYKLINDIKRSIFSINIFKEEILSNSNNKII